jgi:FAD:protein FMN transferase
MALLFVLLLAGGGCQSPTGRTLERFTFSEPHMGSLFHLVLYAADGQAATNAASAAFARIAALNQAMTDYNPQSELMRLRERPAGQPTPVSADLFDVLQRAQRIAQQTDGAFDVTIGEFIQLWRRARRQRELPSPERIAAARQSSGWQNLVLDPAMRTVTLLKPDMRLDLGGIAKGYAADAALAALRQHGIRRALVAASGDIAVGDPPPGQPGWRVGVASVDAQGKDLTTTLLLANRAVSTSGDAEQFVEIGGVRYSHIVDPGTGLGLTNRIGVTIVARDATTTDCLATAVSVLGVEQGLAFVRAQGEVEALIVRLVDGRRTVVESPRFQRFRVD